MVAFSLGLAKFEVVMKISAYIMVSIPFATLCQACTFARSEHLNVRFTLVYGVSLLAGMGLGLMLMTYALHKPTTMMILDFLLLFTLSTTLAAEVHKWICKPGISEGSNVD